MEGAMARDADDINKLITSIYATPLDASGWYGVMTEMAAMFDGAAAMLAFGELAVERRLE